MTKKYMTKELYEDMKEFFALLKAKGDFYSSAVELDLYVEPRGIDGKDLEEKLNSIMRRMK